MFSDDWGNAILYGQVLSEKAEKPDPEEGKNGEPKPMKFSAAVSTL